VPARMRAMKFQWREPRTVAFSQYNHVMSPSDAFDLESPLRLTSIKLQDKKVSKASSHCKTSISQM